MRMLLGVAIVLAITVGNVMAADQAKSQDRSQSRICAQDPAPECPGVQIQQRDRDRTQDQTCDPVCEEECQEYEWLWLWMYGEIE